MTVPPAANPTDADADQRFMAAALALGRQGLGRTAPNPSVGALVVRDGVIVGRGRTGDGGRPHGEIVALAEAGEAARGATLYVTLEPCSHHGATPPCCEAVVAAGIARLVYATDDPNPLVAGRGAEFCRTAGLDVVVGVHASAARRDHRGHALRMIAGRPSFTLKLAETADGFVAGGPHDPRLAITGLAANGAVHVMRAQHDAIMVGMGTVRGDDPLMTVRLPGSDARPVRIVLDPGLSISPRTRLLQTTTFAPVLILAGEGAAASHAFAGIEGLDVEGVPTDAAGRLDLHAALRLLGRRGLTRIFCEGGPTLAAGLIAQGLADEVVLFTAPRPLGGAGLAGFASSARQALQRDYRLVVDRMVGADRLRHWELA